MYLEVGPASMTVTAKRRGVVLDLDGAVLERRIWALLEDVGDYLPVLKQKARRIRKTDGIVGTARAMVEAAQLVHADSLTPMAAVAGALADDLKAYLKGCDAEFISVNNGGDVSIFSAGGRPVRTVIGDAERGRETPYLLNVNGLADFGIATSGFGGRSFTLGIADVVTVIARTAAVADAAATYIGNMTNVYSGNVTRMRAGDIDPATDIADEMVTTGIGTLSEREIEGALDNGLRTAENLRARGVVIGAVIVVRGKMTTTIGGDRHIALEVAHGSEEDSNVC
jgi:ApbE superfamily uncharacterized protein (UPF0280 family)